MAFTHDVFILGHGIAGAVLFAVLRARGLRVQVFDRKRPGNASMAAAGVVNPLVLKRDVPSWRAAELLPEAQDFYSALEQRYGVKAWHPMDLVKLFPTPKEAVQWEQAMVRSDTRPFIDRRPQPMLEHAPLLQYQGHGTVHAAAWLDVPLLLEAQRQYARAEGSFTELEVEDGAVERMAGGFRIGDRSAPWSIRCTGAFGDIPGMVRVKGEGLTVHIPGMDLPCMVHRGVFLLPLGGGLYRVGATFAWDDVWAGPSAEAKAWLLQKLRGVTTARVEVIEHWCGVRPASRDRRPILGVTAPGEAVLNGLGSRGVILAPWCARHLAEHLFDGEPLDPEVSVSRFTDVA